MNYYDMLLKVNNCIDSCVTIEQVDSCQRIYSTIMKRFEKRFIEMHGCPSDAWNMDARITRKRISLRKISYETEI